MSAALRQGLEMIRDGLRPLGENVNIPTTDRQLLDLTFKLTGIKVPEHQICPDHVAPSTAFCDAYFARSPVTVWKAARGLGGKSVLLATLSMMEAVTLGVGVSLLGGSGEQARRIHDYMRGEEPSLPDKFWKWKDAPRYLLRQESTIKETKLVNHGRINVLMASQSSVRGGHPVRLRVDECILEGCFVSTSTGEKPIEDIQIGDTVFGWDGSQLSEGVVKYTRKTGVRKTINLLLSNGRILKCTPDHKVLTKDGWKEAGECKEGTVLQGMQQGIACKQRFGLLPEMFLYTQRRKQKVLQDLWKAFEIRKTDTVGVYRSVPRMSFQGERRKGFLLYGLRQETWHDKKRRSLYGLLSGIFGKEKGKEQVSLHGLWKGGKRQENKKVQALFNKGKIEVWQQSLCGISGDYTKKESFQSGIAMSGAIGLNGYSMENSSSFWELVNRLLGRKSQSCYRSSRGVLARSTKGNGEGQQKETETRGAWLQSFIPENRENAPVVIPDMADIRVLAIRDGIKGNVYDLTIEGLHSFVTEGVVVHNCDEVDMAILQAARGQPQSSRGIQSQMVFSSTHHNPDGTMTAVLKEAAEKSFPVMKWCWRETAAAWLSQEEIERKRQMVTNQMWEVEFDLQEPTSEGRAIMVEKLNSTFKRELGEYKPGPGELIIAEPYVEGGSYVTGADWAKRKDWTVIITMRYDVEPARVVAFEYTGRLPWPAMIAKFDRRMEMYPGNGIHDRTGIGDVVDDYLEEDAYGVVMVGNKRKSLFTHYIGAIEGGKIEGPYIEKLFDEHKYASYEDIYGSGHPPDSFVAAALAWDICSMGW